MNELFKPDYSMVPQKWRNKVFEKEEQLQASGVIMISQEFPKLRGKVWHTKNELWNRRLWDESEDEWEKRKMREGNQDKVKGKLAGVPDLLAVYNGVLYKSELKLPGKHPSPAQVELHEIWKKDCPEIPVEVHRSLEEIYIWCVKILKNDFKINFS